MPWACRLNLKCCACAFADVDSPGAANKTSPLSLCSAVAVVARGAGRPRPAALPAPRAHRRRAAPAGRPRRPRATHAESTDPAGRRGGGTARRPAGALQVVQLRWEATQRASLAVLLGWSWQQRYLPACEAGGQLTGVSTSSGPSTRPPTHSNPALAPLAAGADPLLVGAALPRVCCAVLDGHAAACPARWARPGGQ